MTSTGVKLILLSVGVIGGGLLLREVLAQTAPKINMVIEQKVKIIPGGSPFEWSFEVTYKNKTNQIIDATAIMQAKHCEGATLALVNEVIVLEPNEEKTIQFEFEFNQQDTVGCPNTTVDFFVWESLAVPKALAKRKTVTINF